MLLQEISSVDDFLISSLGLKKIHCRWQLFYALDKFKQGNLED
jgi:hypothetical protein